MPALPAGWGEILKPYLLGNFGLAYDAYPTTYSTFYKKIKSTRAYEQLLQVAGIGLLQARNVGEEAEEESPASGYLVTVEPTSYSKSMIIYKELAEDDQNGLVATFPGLLAKASRESEEVLAFTPIANGLSTNGWDGVPLFSASHPKVGGGTRSNLITKAALSMLSMSAAATQIKRMKSDKGYVMNLQPEYLLTVPELEYTAKELLQSTDRPDTPNRATNVMHNWVGLIVTPYLSSTTFWGITIKGIDNGFVYIDRYGTEQDVEFYPKKRAVEHIIHRKLVFTYADWLKMFGCEGA